MDITTALVYVKELLVSSHGGAFDALSRQWLFKMACLFPRLHSFRGLRHPVPALGGILPPLRSPRSSSRRLAAFLRLRGLKVVVDGTFSLISAAWRDSAYDPCERAWVWFKEFLWPEDYLSIPFLWGVE